MIGVETCSSAALQAETAFLRSHALRRTPGRRRAAPQPGIRVTSTVHKFYRGGYTAAMAEVLTMAAQSLARTGSPGAALDDVAALAGGVLELEDERPPAWMQEVRTTG